MLRCIGREAYRKNTMETTMSDSDSDAPTSATARLPGLDIEITRRRSTSGEAEQISINLQAVPSFEAFSRFVESVAQWTIE